MVLLRKTYRLICCASAELEPFCKIHATIPPNIQGEGTLPVRRRYTSYPKLLIKLSPRQRRSNTSKHLELKLKSRAKNPECGPSSFAFCKKQQQLDRFAEKKPAL
jgi:hypothetical protein